MKILVTGGAGRLGSEVVSLAAGIGHDIVAFDLPQARWGSVEGITGVENFKGDITDPDLVRVACQGVGGVIHLAAILPPGSEADRDLTMRVNVEGSRNIIEALGKGSAATLVFASSVSTYGVTNGEDPPLSEDRPLQAHNVYSESKIEVERLIVGSEVPHVVLRIAPITVVDVVELPETISYRGDQRVEFVYVEDAAQALISALMSLEAKGGIFNVAGGASWQMTGEEYIARFYEALGVEVNPKFSEWYTGVDWYDTSRGLFLGYQRLTFNGLTERLKALGEDLGLR
jgi:nucleoside-diphosphate-sugar epimerase